MNGIEAMQSIKDRRRELVIRSHEDDAGQVVVAVTDRGVGIADESIDKLFNAFFSTKPDGLGMGLSICRSIIEAHRGGYGHLQMTGRVRRCSSHCHRVDRVRRRGQYAGLYHAPEAGGRLA